MQNLAETQCDCENPTCKLDHLPGDCGNVGMVRTAQGYLCVPCAECISLEKTTAED